VSYLYESIRPEHRVLDLCSGPGTFRIPRHFRLLVSMDADVPGTRPPGEFVRADAHRVPLAGATVDVVIAAHCLEHVERPEQVLGEIGRVLRPGGLLYVSVPRWDSLTDRVYRWLYDGGGHIAPWRTADEVVRRVEAATGLRLLGQRKLYTSLRFVIRPRVTGWKRWLCGWARPSTVSGVLWLLWLAGRDRWLDYGWEFYFGREQAAPELEEEHDVCCACGAGHSAAWLAYGGHLERRWGVELFRCPDCRRLNFRRSA